MAILTPLLLLLAPAQQAAPTLTPMPASAPADAPIPPEALAAARRLLTATGADERRGSIIDDTVNRLMAFTFATCTIPVRKRDSESCAVRERNNKRMRAAIEAARPELLAAILDAQERAYASRLSIAEMEATTAFANTPAGRQFFLQAGPAAIAAFAASRSIMLDKVGELAPGIEFPKQETIEDPAR